MFNKQAGTITTFMENGGRIVMRSGCLEHFRQLEQESIYHAVVFSPSIRLADWGLPSELVTLLAPAVSFKRVERKQAPAERRCVCFALPDADSDPGLRVTQRMMQAFNIATDFDALMVLPPDIIATVKRYSNEDLRFLPYNDSDPRYMEHCDLLLTTGETAVRALMNGIPVIVIGPSGIGGRVNDGNLEDLIRQGFNGRIGGTPNEELPLGLIHYEIKRTLEDIAAGSCCALSDSSLAHLRAVYIDNDNGIQINNLLQHAQGLYTTLRNEKLALSLRPAICSNIKVQEDAAKGVITVRNIYTGQVITTVNGEEAAVGSTFDGNNTVQDIMGMFPDAPPAQLLGFMCRLWELKVIFFPGIH